MLADHISMGRRRDRTCILFISINTLLLLFLFYDPSVRSKFQEKMEEMEGYDVVVDWLYSVLTYEMLFGGMLCLITATGIIQALNVLPSELRFLALA